MPAFIPQVLLFGNGLNMACGGVSWSGLIDSINVRTDIHSFKDSAMPMPMQAILATNNNIKDAMKGKSQAFMGKFANAEQGSMMRDLLRVRFDDILTTNYSYEMEIAAAGKTELSARQVAKLMRSTVGRAERQYLLHTYNSVPFEGNTNRVWHVHGGSRKPDSMILGHYWYASQLAKMKAFVDNRQNQYQEYEKREAGFNRSSWIDSFILGDIYVLGFGFDFAEIDLWWLLNRKARENANTGKLYFYEPSQAKEYEKTELLRLMGAEIEHLDYLIDGVGDDRKNELYGSFYRDAIRDIGQRVAASRSTAQN